MQSEIKLILNQTNSVYNRDNEEYVESELLTTSYMRISFIVI